MSDFYIQVMELLKQDVRFFTPEGEFLRNTVFEKAMGLDPELLALLYSDEAVRQRFFVEAGGVTVFDKQGFAYFINNRSFLPDSYTRFRNRIGLADGRDEFISAGNDVALLFPYKDCVLAGGQRDDEERRREIFYNERLAPDALDRLLAPKALCGALRFDANGIQPCTAYAGENLIINGNNVMALSSVLQRFYGQVKCIYIDPPYNTGSDGFNYNDSFRHSTWLVFMKNRLELARRLLRPDGFIFVQCDDNEQAYLKVLMDELFGRENFDSCVSVIVKTEGRRYGNLAKTHEYILVYARDLAQAQLNEIEVKEKKFTYRDARGGFDLKELRNQNTRAFNDTNRPNLRYPFYLKSEPDADGLMQVSPEKGEGEEAVLPITVDGRRSVWRWGREKAGALAHELCARRGSDDIVRVYQKYRSHSTMAKTVWMDKNYISNKGTKEIQALFGKAVFAFPKAEALVQRVLELATQPGDLVLDFFLGSGTTAAVAHKMGRRYIGVEQMPYVEEVICRRLEKVIAGEGGGVSTALGWSGGGSFIYCRLAQRNARFAEEITACTDSQALYTLAGEIFDSGYINCRADVQPADFEDPSLSLEAKKKLLLELLDKNQLYVALADLDDEETGLTGADRAFTRSFYEGAWT